MKQITLYANEHEVEDFELVKLAFERRSDADTVRAMISFCKKNLTQNVVKPTNCPKKSTEEKTV